ncbi:hypothetical protein [Seonamhaeicola marinus]|uniref:Lipoprotein n=1 Tax=Seonamhaeicola marinus TaxID=1912246 RepID=A0A5D0HS76_9FLAO|nr:hypothetical protein [Seonamhaeicola marinus]TYA74095.1 hypothetical protein FUA24_12170 [Seonamhaeicola marinus]
MLKVKQLLFFALMLLVMMSFSQCGSVKKGLESEAPVDIKEAYYKEWSNPARGMGSGLNLFLVLNSKTNAIVLDSVYFRGKQAKLTLKDGNTFFGKFKTDKNTMQKDIVMSSDSTQEYNNTMPKITRIPFELERNECVVSYKDGNKTKYFKISNISKRASNNSLDVPM